MGYHVNPVAFHDKTEQLHILCKLLYKNQTLQTCNHSQIFLMDIVRNFLNKAEHYDPKRQLKISQEEEESEIDISRPRKT